MDLATRKSKNSDHYGAIEHQRVGEQILIQMLVLLSQRGEDQLLLLHEFEHHLYLIQLLAHLMQIRLLCKFSFIKRFASCLVVQKDLILIDQILKAI